MYACEVHLSETAGWRALLNEAQARASVSLPSKVEEYVLSVLFRYAGRGTSDELALGMLRRMSHDGQQDLRAIGDECLLFAGLFPASATRSGLPLRYVIELGIDAYLEYAEGSRELLFALVAKHFVDVMDVLQSIEVGSAAVEPDLLDAYEMWTEVGSQRGFETLCQAGGALPALERGRSIH